MVTSPNITSELAEETGWHIGDGSMNFYKNGNRLRGVYQLRGHIDDDKPHYVERIKSLFEKLYGTKINLREMPSTRVFGFQIWNDNLVKFKQRIGLPLGKKFKVVIPEIFLKGPKLKTAIVRGIFDTDGCIYLEKKNKKLYPRMEIRTISLELSDQLLKILNDLEFRVTRHSELFNGDFKRQRTYVISIRGVEMFHKFMEKIIPKNPKHIRKYQIFLNSKAF